MAGSARVLLRGIEQHMALANVPATNPAVAPQTAILSRSRRPQDPQKHLQYVDLTLDGEGKCHLRPPGPRSEDIVLDDSNTQQCMWERASRTILLTTDSNLMKALRRKRNSTGWGLVWQDRVVGGSKTGPGPRLRVRLADNLLEDVRSIVSRLTPRPTGGNQSVDLHCKRRSGGRAHE